MLMQTAAGDADAVTWDVPAGCPSEAALQGEVRRLLGGDGQLNGAEIGYADHTNLAIAPGLGGGPFHQIIAIFGFLF